LPAILLALLILTLLLMLQPFIIFLLPVIACPGRKQAEMLPKFPKGGDPEIIKIIIKIKTLLPLPQPHRAPTMKGSSTGTARYMLTTPAWDTQQSTPQM
jgi:hypothetical protein